MFYYFCFIWQHYHHLLRAYSETPLPLLLRSLYQARPAGGSRIPRVWLDWAFLGLVTTSNPSSLQHKLSVKICSRYSGT